jgi:hypothetical protein
LLCPGAPSISFAPIVQARHHLDRADRFAILGYGSVFRLKPFRPHLTAGALSCATNQPNTTTNGHRTSPLNSAQRGITPAFGYGPRLGPVRLDFHQQALCAARRTLRPPPTPTQPATHFPRSSVIGRHAPATPFRRLPGRGGPPQFPPSLSIRSAPHTPGSPSRLRFQALRRFPGLRPEVGGSALPRSHPLRAGCLTTPQASLHATDRTFAPPHRAFDTGLRHQAFPPDAASLLPGLLAATRTGLTPASNGELTNSKMSRYLTASPPALLGAQPGGIDTDTP